MASFVSTRGLSGRAGMLVVVLASMLTVASPARAQTGEPFAVTPLQLLLAGDGSVLVRLDDRRFVASGPGRAVETVRRVVTVLNADGREGGRFGVSYDRLRRLKRFSGQLRDVSGKVVRKLKKDDQEDYSAIAGYSLYDDLRVRTAAFYHDAYPYTVEFEYELEYDGLVHWPVWYPQEDGAAVELSRFEIDAPAALQVRYEVRGMDLQPEVTRAGARQTLRWTVQALPPFEKEPFGPSAGEQAASVHTAADRFEVEGTRGETTSWEAFGRWYHGLSDGRQKLPAEVLAEVRALVADAPDAREKARRLYAYLQERTRYVSIQLGLGGWQPFDAQYVHTRGYGDCKALTNYMQALLRAVDVAAYPALIRSGVNRPEVLAELPGSQFNHVVLFVPLGADTLWLENTSQTIPFGHLGADNEDRYALVVRPGGGELVRTPRSRAHDNLQLRRGRVVLTATGDATADVQTTYAGNQQDRVRGALARRSGRDRTEWLHNTLALPSFEVVRADFDGVEAHAPEVRLPVSLRLPRYAAKTGTRLFFRPCLMDAWTVVPPAVEARTQPVRTAAYAFADFDTLDYVLPGRYRVEAMPEPVAIETPFGRYEASIALQDDGTLAYRRRFEITETKLPPEHYDAFRDFLRQVAQADRAQVVLAPE